MQNTAHKRFKILAYAEGISFLLILFVTMPLKYGLDIHWPNEVIGMAHGILFMAYVVYVIYMKATQGWSWLVTALGLAASVVPFGTFIFEWRCLRDR